MFKKLKYLDLFTKLKIIKLKIIYALIIHQ